MCPLVQREVLLHGRPAQVVHSEKPMQPLAEIVDPAACEDPDLFRVQEPVLAHELDYLEVAASVAPSPGLRPQVVANSAPIVNSNMRSKTVRMAQFLA